MEPLLSLNQERTLLGSLKGVRRISYGALVRLVKQEGLPTVPNPFKPGTWAFTKSLTLAWFEAYTNPDKASEPRPMRGPGRPRKNVA